MKRIYSVLAFLSASCVAAQQPLATNVHNKGVTYKGLYANEIEGFLGIRFGHDTGGANRFRPPIPYTPKPGSVIEATDPGPACPQRVVHGDPNPFNAYALVKEISEDCLKLNVWRPNGTSAGDKLPVLVYIYGGGFNTGTKDGVLSQPGGMQLQAIENGHPIMNVEMNYRLGVFGFAQSDALYKEGSENAGIRDQRLAIEWVQKNIAAFGGDPERITIHGQSSGGLAVGMQIMAYGGSKPVPFQQAICESQALEPGITGNFTLHSTYRVYLEVNCTNYPFDSPAAAECLRRVPLKNLIAAQLAVHSPSPKQNDGDNWLPVVDGDFVPAAPSTLMAEGKFANIRTIIGWTDNDFMLFVPLDLKTPNQTYTWIRQYLAGFTDAHVRELLSLYPSSEFPSTYYPDGKVKIPGESYRCGRIARDVLFTCQPIYYGQVLAEAGNTVYFYNQNQSMFSDALRAVGLAGLGVVHTSELLYVFGNLSKYDFPGYDYDPTPSDFRLRDQESRSWSSFTAVGQPSLKGHDTLPDWKPADFNDENYGTYVIGGHYPGYSGPGGSEPARVVMAREKLRQRCGFLNSPEIIKELQY